GRRRGPGRGVRGPARGPAEPGPRRRLPGDRPQVEPGLPWPAPGPGRRARPPGRPGTEAPPRRLVLRGQKARPRRGLRLSSRRPTRLGAAVLPAPRSRGAYVLRALRP